MYTCVFMYTHTQLKLLLGIGVSRHGGGCHLGDAGRQPRPELAPKGLGLWRFDLLLR